ncbi:MAG: UDP-D-galactose:(glucosyl)LPS alpha,6-D-galactosyltransferase [Pseudothermotoga sp.]|nr:UDP-D-galactose:(glucosyl)LPS alpha,6-D-galactosyltransferase [Pseudothermotoga sp.]MDK2954485.1 UDP-D-galactose:(glucosyl)LPS alpha,6-D-galactosyltransferase [Kosmotoga sp.]
MTSRFKGLGHVLIEAISYGIPVISSDCEKGPRDIDVLGVNGSLYKKGNLREFVKIVTDFVKGKLSIASPEKMKATVRKFKISLIYRELLEIANRR